MWNNVSSLVEQIHPQLLVFNRHMDVHAADHQPPCHLLQIFLKIVVTGFWRMFQFFRPGPRMR